MPIKICKPYREAKPNQLTQGFSKEHQAVDFGYRYGTFLVAPEDCRIFAITTSESIDEKLEGLARGYGVFMEALGNPKRRYGYWHCLPIFPVKIGDIVNQGQIVGQMGNSGFVISGGEFVPVEIRTKKPYRGTHLHWSMTIDNVPQNPLDFINWEIEIKYDIFTAIRNILNKILVLLKRK